MPKPINISKTVKTRIQICLPFLTGAALCVISVLLWWTLDRHEQRHIQNKLKVEAESIGSHIVADLRNRASSARRMALRWENHRGINKDEFISDACAHIADFSGFQALEWVDKDSIVRWIVPLEGNEKAQDINSALYQNRRVAMENARETRLQTMTEPIDLLQGEKGFLIYSPIYIRDEFGGFIVAVFRAKEWLDYVFNVNRQIMTDDFGISVYLDELPVYKNKNWDLVQKSDFNAVASTTFMERQLLVRIKPTQAYISNGTTNLDEVILFLGFLLSVFVAFIMYLHQKAYQMKAELEYKTILLETQAETSIDGILAVNNDDHIILFNKQFVGMFKVPENILGKKDDKMLLAHVTKQIKSPEEFARRVAYLYEHQDEKSNDELELLEGRSFDRYSSPLRSAAGKHLGRIWYFRDSTQKKLAEKALKISEERYSQLAEHSRTMVWELDSTGLYTHLNQISEKILGYKTEEIVGKLHFYDLHPEEGREEFKAAAFEILNQKESILELENPMQRKDGRIVWVSTSAIPIIDTDGFVLGYRGTDNDITERKEAEALLSEERCRLSSIIEGTQVGTWEWNVQTGKTVFNEQWANIIGYTLTELAPVSVDTWRKSVHPEDYIMASGLLEKYFKKELPYFECETRMRHKNGNWVWILSRGKVATWTDDGKPLLMFGTEQVINDRKLAELEKAKLEEENRQLQKTESLGRMSGAIAHHFNNQLSVVMGYLEMVIANLSKSDPHSVKLSTAMQAARKAAEISGLLLTYLGQRQRKFETLDFSGLCRSYLPVLKTGIPQNITFETDIPSSGLQILADAKSIQVVLTNLISNAWESIGDKPGLVRLTLKTVSKTDIPESHRYPVEWQPQEQSYVCLEIADSGCGIEEKDIDKIFDPFFSTKFIGRGLGLSVVLGIARAHEAAITVESRIGTGSVFRVFFPLQTQMT
jgi:PAS domain S-box-containing protein